MKTQRPAYVRVEQDLRKRISSGHWPVGVPLPSRQTLADEYSVAVGTVQQALANIINDGVIRSEHGKGTYVTGQGMVTDITDTAENGKSPLRRLAVVAGVQPIDSPYYQGSGSTVGVTLAAIERAHGASGGSIFFYNRRKVGDDWEPMSTAITQVDMENTDAIILVGIHANLENSDDFVRAAGLVNVPIVCLTPGELPALVPHVFYDNRFGGFMAARHLIDRGHKSLLFLAPFTSSWGMDRLAGARQACAHEGLPSDAITVFPPSETVESVSRVGYFSQEMAERAGYESGQTLFTESQLPPAIIAINDPVAIGFIRATRERGLEPGRDYAIIGFDNIDAARTVGLTSLQPPWEAMSEEAVRLLKTLTDGGHGTTQSRICPHLVPRQSTARMGTSRN